MTILLLCLLVALLGLAAILIILKFGLRIYGERHPEEGKRWWHFWDHLFHRIEKDRPWHDMRILARHASDAYIESLQRRNEFWSIYGQVIIAVLIIVILSMLLLTKTISPEAGLPILSGVSGFAIAKGISSGRGPLSNDGPNG